MKVKLISSTQPNEELREEGIVDAQELVAFCARVSNPANQYNTETSEKLIRFLISNKHWSPLEMVDATLEIETTRDIARQILRHRSFTFQEFSQRYADPTQEFQFVLRDARLQDPKNRQNSFELDITDESQLSIDIEWKHRQEKIMALVTDTYKWAIDNGIAKEQARAVLPEGLTMSRLYVHGTVRSWIHYIEVRAGNGTQLEHMEVARACAQAIAKIFPLATSFVTKEM